MGAQECYWLDSLRGRGTIVTSGQKIYSVPRKLDLASLFVFTTGYGLLFALMKLLRQEALQFLVVAGFFTSVGIAQAVLFQGKAPRLASWLTGGAYASSVLIFYELFNRNPANRVIDLCSVLSLFAVGCIWGYVAGTCIAGIFLIADKLRSQFKSERL
jgi:hypothetical protein